jgi:hypothetical protein
MVYVTRGAQAQALGYPRRRLRRFGPLAARQLQLARVQLGEPFQILHAPAATPSGHNFGLRGFHHWKLRVRPRLRAGDLGA